jgi:hypothetical protein
MEKPEVVKKSEAYREAHDKAGEWIDRVAGFSAGVYHRAFPPRREREFTQTQEKDPAQTEEWSSGTLFIVGLCLLAVGGLFLWLVAGGLIADIRGTAPWMTRPLDYPLEALKSIVVYLFFTITGLVSFSIGLLFALAPFLTGRRA